MKNIEKIRKIYSIVVGALVVAAGVALICVAADIYYSGKGTGVIFTREIVAQRLTALAIPLILLIGIIAAGALFPLYETRAKASAENAVCLLSKKLPAGGDGEEYRNAANSYKKLRQIQLGVFIGAGAVLLGCIIAVLCYVLNVAHFLSEDITAEIFAMVKNVLPWIAVAFATLIAATVANGVISKRKLVQIKIMIKSGDKSVATPEESRFIATAKSILNSLNSALALWIVRGAVFVIAVTFIIIGIFNGGAHDVLVKAINICTECIGLG